MPHPPYGDDVTIRRGGDAGMRITMVAETARRGGRARAGPPRRTAAPAQPSDGAARPRRSNSARWRRAARPASGRRDRGQRPDGRRRPRPAARGAGGAGGRWSPIPKSPARTGQSAPGVPTLRDRAAQTVARLALEPEWEARFEPDSYGFRPGRSVHDAIEAVHQAACFKPKYV